MNGTTTLHPTASIYTVISAQRPQGTAVTASTYVGDDVWMEESELTVPYTHGRQDPLAVAVMAFAPWWPNNPHSLPAIEERKAA